MFCDAVLLVQHQTFLVHKLILIDSSQFFRAMFERWDHHNDKDFRVGGISPETMSLVLEWIYTKSIVLRAETVQDLLLAADMLLLDQLVLLCFQFMEENMSPENCIGIWKFSDVVLSSKTRDLARRFILRKFEEVMDCEEYQDLTGEELSGFIERDELHVKDETVVFKAIVHWTNHNVQERREHFPQLLSKVRFVEISCNFIHDNILNNPLVNNISCSSIMANALDTISELIINPGALHRLHRPRLPEAVLLAVGGMSSGNPINEIEAYDYKVDRWVHIMNSERPRAYHGCVFLDGSLYCVGGYDGPEYFNSVSRLDLATNTWHEMAPMDHRRCYVSVAALNGLIYAMGGFDGNTRLNTAEVFDPQTRCWSLITPMNEQRSDAKCAALNGKIYICGGFDGSQCLQTAECYSPETNQWSFIAPMTTRRSGVSVTAYDNSIYVVGGFDGTERLRSVEVYSPRSDSWREVASMNTTRSNFGIAVLNNRIFAVGGYDGFSTTFRAEAYDPLVDSWSEVCGMDVFRSALNCCVISDLPNMSDYTFPRHALPLLDVAT
ncbi:kelch-like protein 10 [Boleophthalmus pectinirostris]|uniref:kelch-like protein 10 n=1 Tax=Boleophthalmus pectinirostris TaxID=150288 RepID=UPI00242E54E6|nr:kelch-like protein 10 [Boleophthalmus pectinirostris]